MTEGIPIFKFYNILFFEESVVTERLERLHIQDSHLAEPKIFQQVMIAFVQLAHQCFFLLSVGSEGRERGALDDRRLRGATCM